MQTESAKKQTLQQEKRTWLCRIPLQRQHLLTLSIMPGLSQKDWCRKYQNLYLGNYEQLARPFRLLSTKVSQVASPLERRL